MTRLLPLLLASCAGSVDPGLPLTAESAEPALACPFVVDSEFAIELRRDDGDCDETLQLDLRMATERLAVFADCTGYATTYEDGCGLNADITCVDTGRILGWMELVDGRLIGALHVSRSVYFDDQLPNCSGNYLVGELDLD